MPDEEELHTDENGCREDIYGDVSDDVWLVRERLKDHEEANALLDRPIG